MFEVLLIKPVFNLLVLIYALIPGHNFGVALILFTILTRLLMWPLVKKQMHYTRTLRELQPELKKIKAATKGNKQKESAMVMELYKEREINPVGSFGIIIVQFIVLIVLYAVVRRIVHDPTVIIRDSYSWVRQLTWMQVLSKGVAAHFDNTLLSFVNLSKSAVHQGVVYWPAFIILLASSIMQYFQTKQIQPTSQGSRGLRQILKDAGSGKKTEQSEVNAAVTKSTSFIIPFVIFFAFLGVPAALALYLLTSSVIAYFQQAYILNKQVENLESGNATKGGVKTTIKNAAAIPEAEVVTTPKPKTPKAKTKSSSKKKRKQKGR